MNVLELYDKLEKLVFKLPGPLQKPILHEITPIKNLFLCRRPPRLVLLGEGGETKAAVMNALFGAEIIPRGESRPERLGWHDLAKAKRGVLRILDARPPTPLKPIKKALASEPADVFLFLRSGFAIDNHAAGDLDFSAEVLEFAARQEERSGGIIGVLVTTGGENIESERTEFRTSLHARAILSEHLRSIFSIPAGLLFDPGAPDDVRKALEPLGEAILEELPENARLEMARLSGVRSVQKRLAQVLVNSAVAISTAIGAQPIPLADLPILLSLQVTLVSGIMYVSGRELSARLAGEFIGALGANLGAGLALREGSRALLKFFPGWGNAISGAIAGAGTYAIGKAAMAYFIEGTSLKDARRLFQRSKAGVLKGGSRGEPA